MMINNNIMGATNSIIMMLMNLNRDMRKTIMEKRFNTMKRDKITETEEEEGTLGTEGSEEVTEAEAGSEEEETGEEADLEEETEEVEEVTEEALEVEIEEVEAETEEAEEEATSREGDSMMMKTSTTSKKRKL